MHGGAPLYGYTAAALGVCPSPPPVLPSTHLPAHQSTQASFSLSAPFKQTHAGATASSSLPPLPHPLSRTAHPQRWATIPKEDWPAGLAEAIAPLWDETHGDRQNELVVIGRNMDKAAVDAALRRCLVTDAELAACPPEAWEQAFGDPWDWAARDPAHDHDHGDHGDDDEWEDASESEGEEGGRGPAASAHAHSHAHSHAH